MELKDNIKQLRLKEGLTQAQLAQKLYVSRSTVAKWENGLGIPNPESMAALEELFSITAKDIATQEPETIIVNKNRKIHIFLQSVFWICLIAFLSLLYILPFAIQEGKYGFTADMVADGYADEKHIDTGDYRIYYFTFDGNDLVTGTYWSDLQGYKVVQRHFWGYTLCEEAYDGRVITHNNYVVGKLYTVKGKNGYYNILKKSKIYKVDQPGDPLLWDIPAELISATSITISGKEYALQDGFFFVTQEPVDWFKIGDSWYDVLD